MEKNKKIIFGVLSVALVLIFVGATYAFVEYSKIGNNQQLVTGDIYMNYRESTALTMSNLMPSDTYDSNNYFEFYITGKNTNTLYDIVYDIILGRGDVPSGKTEANRIQDRFIVFKLVERVNNADEVIFTDRSYEDLSSGVRAAVATIPKNTTSEITHTYRLYMRIDRSVIIGNPTTQNKDYDQDTWNNLFASVKVSATGDFDTKEADPGILTGAEKVLLAARTRESTVENCLTTVTDQEDGIVYISGKSDNPSIYANAATDSCVIDFNYVWWSGKMWRITSVYPDGAMKMITDNNISTINFNASGQVYYYTKPDPENSIVEAKSYMFQWLNEDFLSTLYNQGADIIDYTKYWNETMPSATAASTKPAETEATMISTTTSPVGLLNSYEYSMIYHYASPSNNYLLNNYNSWLLNPYYNSSSPTNVQKIGNNGLIATANPKDASGVRPSIIVKSGVIMSGNGTKTSPYRIAADYADATANDSLYTRHSGEYIKFSSDGNNGDYTNAPLYRIVEVVGSGSTRTTKIVSMNFSSYDVSGTPTYTKQFGAANNATGVTWGTCTSNDCWNYYLNDLSGEWYTNLSFKNKLTSGTYYLGRVSSGSNYKLSVCSDSNFDASNTISDCITNGTIATTWVGSNGDSGNVGILRFGEMFAARQQPGDKNSINNMSLISSYNSASLNDVFSNGNHTYVSASASSHSVRPSYFLKSSVNVLSGSGTEIDPFIVD